MKIIDIINKLSTARLEYQTNNGSVLNKFVVPFFIDRLDIRKISHSIALVGSRGSGKSTYIQYFSHSTRFDKSLSKVDEKEFECLLLYWKPDIAYCQGLKSNWLGDDAIRFFSLHTSVSLIDELSKLIKNIDFHFSDLINSLDKNGNFWRAISRVTGEEITNLDTLETWIMDFKYDLSTRLNPLNTSDLPSIEPKQMLDYLLRSLRIDYSRISNTTFKIFVDEFELLNIEQQKLINTYRKESNSALSWNVAYKSNARPINETTSDQWLQSPDDYTEENLDNLIESNYKIFAAEILILTFQNSGLKCKHEFFTPKFLGDRLNIEHRKSSKYQEEILSLIQKILPTPSISQLSSECLKKSIVKTRLSNLFEGENLDKETRDLILSDPSLAITILGTHRQKSFDLMRFINYSKGKLSENDKKRVKEKIATFEFNTLLSLNLQHASIQIPLYAGFDRFITMSTPNIRHFKELCLSALKHSDEIDLNINFEYIEEIKRISELGMHLGAISSSSNLVKEVNSYPPHGNKLSQMVNRIGELFRISQKSSHQTEPERDIFTITYEYAGSDSDLEAFLSSALSWRVLVEDDSRRIKDDRQITTKEFQLNPVYSPRFGISYRKKRGITFSLNEFKTLIAGSSEEFDGIKKKYQNKWKSDDSESKQGILL